VRLHGIDPPETGQDFGTRVKQAASELTFGRLAAHPIAALRASVRQHEWHKLKGADFT
jgi:hypothetical protein